MCAFKGPYEFFEAVNNRMHKFKWVPPAPIQISTNQASSIVAIYDAVNIQHGQKLEHVLIAKILRLFRRT